MTKIFSFSVSFLELMLNVVTYPHLERLAPGRFAAGSLGIRGNGIQATLEQQQHAVHDAHN